MAYDNSSINKFIQKQGGNLQNLGASPTYTGAPANKGTPPGPQSQQPYVQANPNAAFQRPQMPGHMPQAPGQMRGQPQRPQMPGQMPGQMPPGVDPRLGVPQTSLANLGGRMDPRMQGRTDPRMQGRQDPRMRQRIEMMRRRQMQDPRRGNLQNLGQPKPAPSTSPTLFQPSMIR